MSAEKRSSIYRGSSNAESGNCVAMELRTICGAIGAARVRHSVQIGSLGNPIKSEIDFLLKFMRKSDREESGKEERTRCLTAKDADHLDAH
jgi:hypothetical protein